LQNGQGTPTTGAVIYLAAEQILGDYNGNGIVDAADYTVWRDLLNQNLSLPGENPDAVTPGVVNQEDYEYWVSRFGATTNPAGGGSLAGVGGAVPEPTTALMLMLGIACMGGLSRRRPV
jgi:hypothetical protein